MPGYLFLSNSNKPTEKEQKSRKAVSLTNVSRPCLQKALDLGYDVWLGANRENPDELQCELPVHMYDSHTYRSLTAFKDNWIAYKNLMSVLKKNDIQVIHCNTPIGGIMGRLCGKRAKVPHVIYTAHGFHFYKGAPLFNRTVLKWAEMLMARWTDVIITMNQEDYEAAQRFKLRKNGKVYYVPGVGIDTEIYRNIEIDRGKLRIEIGIQIEDFVILSVGDLNRNKNNRLIIEALGKLKYQGFTEIKSIHYVLCGVGNEKQNLMKLSQKFGIESQVHFLGFRTDVNELYHAVDLVAVPSYREGLSRVIMEAMASGLPCIASRIRGNIDLIDDGKGGCLFSIDNVDEVSEQIKKIVLNEELRKNMIAWNLEKIRKFDVNRVKELIAQIYETELGEKGKVK